MRVLLRAMVVWLLIVVAESINGTLREMFLVPLLGFAGARLLSFLTALILISTITALTVRWIGAVSEIHLLVIGVMWAGLMFSFEWALGRFALGVPFEKFAAEYDPRQGGLMSFGMLFLIFIPMIANRMSQWHRRADSEELQP